MLQIIQNNYGNKTEIFERNCCTDTFFCEELYNL